VIKCDKRVVSTGGKWGEIAGVSEERRRSWRWISCREGGRELLGGIGRYWYMMMGSSREVVGRIGWVGKWGR
jgi:hypothetical protein